MFTVMYDEYMVYVTDTLISFLDLLIEVTVSSKHL